MARGSRDRATGEGICDDRHRAVACGGLPRDDRSRFGQRAGGGGHDCGQSPVHRMAIRGLAAGFVRASLSAGIPGLLRLPDDWIRLRRLWAGFRGARLRERCAKRPARRCGGSSRSRTSHPSRSCGKTVRWRSPIELRPKLRIGWAITQQRTRRSARALELRRTIPTRTLSRSAMQTIQLMLAASIAARLQRYAEAQQIIEPVLENASRALRPQRQRRSQSTRPIRPRALCVCARGSGTKDGAIDPGRHPDRRPAAADAPPDQHRIPARSDRGGAEGAALAGCADA